MQKPDEDGWQSLHWATFKGHTEIALLLLHAGVYVYVMCVHFVYAYFAFASGFLILILICCCSVAWSAMYGSFFAFCYLHTAKFVLHVGGGPKQTCKTWGKFLAGNSCCLFVFIQF